MHRQESIEVALERKDLGVMAWMRDKGNVLVGNLNNYLKEALHFILKKGKITAKELSDSLKLEANTRGTRLMNLYKKRLVKRIDEMRNGGRGWVYERV